MLLHKYRCVHVVTLMSRWNGFLTREHSKAPNYPWGVDKDHRPKVTCMTGHSSFCEPIVLLQALNTHTYVVFSGTVVFVSPSLACCAQCLWFAMKHLQHPFWMLSKENCVNWFLSLSCNHGSRIHHVLAVYKAEVPMYLFALDISIRGLCDNASGDNWARSWGGGW